MKIVLTVAIAIAMLALIGGVVLAQSGNDLFQQALVKERTEDNLPDAIKLYQTIVQKYGSDRKLAAKALFQIGQAYEKLGNTEEARKAYERIAREFADQKEVAADAGRRLAALDASRPSDTLAARLVKEGPHDQFASIAPDDRMIMTDWSSGDLAIRDMSTGQIKRLMAKTGPWGEGSFGQNPVLSPDLRQVAYIWLDARDGYQLRVMPNEAGGKPRVLISKNPEIVYFEPCDWSRDSKFILAILWKPDTTRQLAWVSAADATVKVLKSLEWRIREHSHPRVSPDGRYIAYSALLTNPKGPKAPPESTDQHIYLLETDGSGETELVKTASINEGPVWTPDGAHIIFTSNLSGKTDLWSIAVRTGKASGSPSLVRRDIGQIHPIGMTRSGSYYYVQIKAGAQQVSIAQLAPDGGSRIVDSFVGIDPAWSPDGKSLAFTRHSDRPRTGDYFASITGDVLLARSIETGDERVYIRDSSIRGKPLWFHSGKGFLLETDSAAALLFDVTSGEMKQVVATDASRSGVAAISPVDKVLYLFSRTNADSFDRIVSVDIATGQEKFMFALPETAGRSVLAVSPDGRTLAVETIDTKFKGRLALVRTDGSDYREIYAFPAGQAGPSVTGPAWTKDSRTILFATLAARREFQIMRIGIEGGRPEFTGLRVKNLSTFDLSPDGSRIAFSTTAKGTSDLLAIDNLPALLKGLQ